MSAGGADRRHRGGDRAEQVRAPPDRIAPARAASRSSGSLSGTAEDATTSSTLAHSLGMMTRPGFDPEGGQRIEFEPCPEIGAGDQPGAFAIGTACLVEQLGQCAHARPGDAQEMDSSLRGKVDSGNHHATSSKARAISAAAFGRASDLVPTASSTLRARASTTIAGIRPTSILGHYHSSACRLKGAGVGRLVTGGTEAAGD